MMELFLKLGMFIIDIIKKPEIDVEEIEFVGEKEDCYQYKLKIKNVCKKIYIIFILLITNALKWFFL